MPSPSFSGRSNRKPFENRNREKEDRENINPRFTAKQKIRLSTDLPDWDLSEDDDFPADFDKYEREGEA